MPEGSDNKRRSSRLQHELPVAYRSVGSFLTDWATNISHGGMFINTRKPLPVGTEVRILIQLPMLESPVGLNGRVTRVAEFDNQANVGARDGHPVHRRRPVQARSSSRPW